MSNVSQGITQAVKIQQGRISHQNKTADVGAVVQVNKGAESTAWRAAAANGADDIQFRSESGDVYIASGSAFEKLDLHVGAQVTLGGVTGRITALDNETNGKGEIMAGKTGMTALGALQGGFIGGVLGVMLIGPLLGGPACLVALGLGIFGGGAAGWLSVDPKVNLDLLKLHGKEVG